MLKEPIVMSSLKKGAWDAKNNANLDENTLKEQIILKYYENRRLK